jgi:hypothetical protein
MPSAWGWGVDTSPLKGCCRATFGCCIGTTQKSATYKISGALQRREVPMRELVENKAQRLKEKTTLTGSLGIFFVLSRKNRRELIFDI